jgi:hypothetical protein
MPESFFLVYLYPSNFYRFAASDRLATDLIPKLPRWISGGVISNYCTDVGNSVSTGSNLILRSISFSVLVVASPILYLWNKNSNANR